MRKFLEAYLVAIVTALAVLAIGWVGAVTGEAAPAPAFTFPFIPFLIWVAIGQMKLPEKYRNPWLWSLLVAVVGAIVVAVLVLV